MMLSSLIDSHKGREVRTMELKGAPLKECVPEDVELVVKRGRPNMLFAVSFLMTRYLIKVEK
jgi:hypothetical protein